MCHFDFSPAEDLWRVLGPEFPYGYIHTQVLPGLRERGVAESEIEQMLVANPRAIFSRR